MTTRHMKAVNGFSNTFFGWGGEDDDMAKRVHLAGLKVGKQLVIYTL